MEDIKKNTEWKATSELSSFIYSTVDYVRVLSQAFLTPEHFLYLLLIEEKFLKVLYSFGINIEAIKRELKTYLDSLEGMEDLQVVLLSAQMTEIFEYAEIAAQAAGKSFVDFPQVIGAFFNLEDSFAKDILMYICKGEQGEFLRSVIDVYSDDFEEIEDDGIEEYENQEDKEDDENYSEEAEDNNSDKEVENSRKYDWKKYVININDNLKNRNPLIGREEELDRTIQVLCRKDKNNPLHIGDPGVGKTALVYGLAERINRGEVPDRLKGAVIYGLEVGSLLAGTQFRGDFEKRLKMIMDGISREKDAIVYIDEIHTLVGAGAIGESAMDASNMLKPYLEKGNIRFIGSTTHDEYKRYFARSKGLVRRFSHININEPGIEETIDILNQLKGKYEDYHGVKYLPEAIEYAVHGSVRYITDRFLPDKAIDLIDEAGAYRQSHSGPGEDRNIDKALISDVLAKVCKVDSVAIHEDSVSVLETLQERLESRVYGQTKAVEAVTEAVQMSKAGLSDDNKPLASLLFVGPTGVGKTELAKALAEELGISLVRFDMSEYVEKHAVAKLIGSPAGYVGYDDGGLLTDAVRKTPNCVLLLDEIEKAHADIYNILLQVMDYGKLTDNKGNKADFTNVVIIMTSNAGARFASQAKMGFASTVTAGNAMLTQVKKTFQPEFMNRLSATVVFNDMDIRMASLVLDKKLRLLQEKLKAKKVKLTVDESVRKHLLSIGFSREYGAREMDRAVNASLKPLLMREILFGSLKDGGEARFKLEDENIILERQS